MKFQPGITSGGKINHDCGNVKAIGWFIEGIIPILAFSKEPTYITFTGITNGPDDLSVDILKNVTLPMLKQFGIIGADLTIKRRGINIKVSNKRYHSS